MKKVLPIKSMASSRPKLRPPLPGTWQLSVRNDKADWIALDKSLRFTRVLPLGAAIAAAVGLRYSNLKSLIDVRQRDKGRFQRLYSRALREVRPDGKLRPVAAHFAKLPQGEKSFVDAGEVWIWLKEAGETLPSQLEDWLRAQDTPNLRSSLLDDHESSKGGLARAAAAPTDIGPFANIDVTLNETAKDAATLLSAWGTLGMILLQNFRKELQAHTWTYLPLEGGRKREGRPVQTHEADTYADADDPPDIGTMKNHVATAIVAAIGFEDCAKSFPKMAEHFSKRGLKKSDFKKAKK